MQIQPVNSALTSLPNVASHMQCIVVQRNFLYVVGGCVSQCAHGESAVSTVYRYDPRLNTWLTAESMLEKRAYFYACKLRVPVTKTSRDTDMGDDFKEVIYSIGGKNKEGDLCSVEKYDLEANAWSLVQPLETACYAHAGCVADNKA